MKIHSALFEVSAPNLSSCPSATLPEFAFIGRSNVGKSSLINLLTGKHDLARVSDLPGKTKLINFFAINDTWRLVDLPGYGYAHVAKTDRADFNEAVADYLEHRENLVCTFLLIDSRLEPQAIDLEFARWIIDTDVPFQIVFTKADKISGHKARENMAAFLSLVFPDADPLPGVFSSSAKTKDGRKEILEFITAELPAPIKRKDKGEQMPMLKWLKP